MDKPQLLIGLDALIDVPRLIAKSFVRVFGNKIEEVEVLSLLMRKDGDEVQVGSALAKQKGREEDEVLRRFYQELHTGAHKLVWPDAYTLLGATCMYPQVIFYGFPQSALEQVTRNANFDVGKVVGAYAGETPSDVAERAAGGDEEPIYVTGGITSRLESVAAQGRRRRSFRTSQYDTPVLLDELEKEK